MAREDRDKGKRSTEGRNVNENIPPKTHMQYDERIVKTVLTRGTFNTWDDVIDWLDTEGRQDDELTPREAASISTDFRRLQQEGALFTKDSKRLLDLIRSHKV